MSDSPLPPNVRKTYLYYTTLKCRVPRKQVTYNGVQIWAPSGAQKRSATFLTSSLRYLMFCRCSCTKTRMCEKYCTWNCAVRRRRFTTRLRKISLQVCCHPQKPYGKSLECSLPSSSDCSCVDLQICLRIFSKDLHFKHRQLGLEEASKPAWTDYAALPMLATVYFRTTGFCAQFKTSTVKR